MRRLLIPAALLAAAGPARAYVEAPQSLGSVIQQSTNIVLMTVTKVDKQQNLIVYQKVQDIKGKHPADAIKHNIGRGGLRAGEWEEIMAWAEVGKPAVFFHNGGASETYIGPTWYQAYPQGEWWGMSHGEPFLLRSYSGKVDKFPALLAEIVAGKEVVVPCLVDGDKEALHKKTARVQRLRCSLKLLDYDPKRDFSGWGGEDIRRLQGFGGFDRYAGLPKLDPEAQAVSVADFDDDGKPDLCLCSANKVVLLQNGGDSYTEVALPGLTGGARAAVWADHDGDGLPDLLLATPAGPRLYTNLGKGRFRDDSSRLPKEPAWNLTAAAWGDFDGDGRPDILLANGFHGLRLYRNARAAAPKPPPLPKAGPWHAIGIFRHKDGPQANFDTAFPVETEPFTPDKEYKGKRDLPTKWAKKDLADGDPHELTDFGQNCASYLYREFEAKVESDVPATFTSPNTLTVWLNGEKVHSDAKSPAEPAALLLKLKPGKNTLLVKMCNTDRPQGFSFKFGTDAAAGPPGPWFADVSAAWGVGPDGAAHDQKGDALTVADFDGDGRPDVLYGAGTGTLLMNTGETLAVKTNAGVSYKPGKVGPAVGDFDGDGRPDLFVPQPDGKCRLYRNKGDGTFEDISADAGDLGRAIPGAVSAAWGDFDNGGRPDLVVGCLRGANRYFRNAGGGKFEDKSAEVGLTQKVFNSPAVAWADLNGDGRLDLILNNEGQEPAVLFGAAKEGGKTPVTVGLNNTPGLAGGRLVVTRGPNGPAVAGLALTGGDGRGGNSLAPRFALDPGTYLVEVRGPGGKTVVADVTVADRPVYLKAGETRP
ncbi:MAG: VCBS repeat-containing protein [Gemmataceae bacterium]|nr:VCBS repeat-containing protein [Gemmataceae bacterium]